MRNPFSDPQKVNHADLIFFINRTVVHEKILRASSHNTNDRDLGGVTIMATKLEASMRTHSKDPREGSEGY